VVPVKKVLGLRPQDVVVLLKVVILDNASWRMVDLASELCLSQSEISESLHRTWYANLLSESKREVFRDALLEFLIHGVRYAFPQRPGAMTRGIPTAHSAPPLSLLIRSSSTVYVWPDADGTARGEAIEPLYPGVPKAARIDPLLYELLSLVDALRVGRAREANLAATELKRRIQRT